MFLFLSCSNKNIEVREIGFHDYVYVRDRNEEFGHVALKNNLEVTRIKGFLLKNVPDDLSLLDFFLKTYARELLSEDFIEESKKLIQKTQGFADKRFIEIDFFRTSKELPWIMDESYNPPRHLGEGNPKDLMGVFVYDIDEGETCRYFICTRSNSLFNYGLIKKSIEWNK